MSSGSADDRLALLRDRLRQFVADRDWQQFHDPKSLAMAIASEAGELLSELRWVSSQNADVFVRDDTHRDRIEREVGDIAIALLLFCDRAGINLLDAVDRKIELNAQNYPAELSKGRSERPSPANVDGVSRVIAVDWSGSADGGHGTIWLAEVRKGVVTRLENGRSRDQVVDHLIELASDDPSIIVGLDFAFGLPMWFLEERQLANIGELWELVTAEGEQWLRECKPPFWGRPGRKKPSMAAEFRQTDLEISQRRLGLPKSVFQIGGAGAVGTGSLRGMPQLARLRRAGFSVWPFDLPAFPLVIEIYPRALTGVVIKSNAEARDAYVVAKYPSLSSEVRRALSGSEDAFDAAVSALVMWDHASEFTDLPPTPGELAMAEGAIWVPQET